MLFSAARQGCRLLSIARQYHRLGSEASRIIAWDPGQAGPKVILYSWVGLLAKIFVPEGW